MDDENRIKMRLNSEVLLPASGSGAAVEPGLRNLQLVSLVEMPASVSRGGRLPWLPLALLCLSRLWPSFWCFGPTSGARAAMLPFQAEQKERRHPPPVLEGASTFLLMGLHPAERHGRWSRVGRN